MLKRNIFKPPGFESFLLKKKLVTTFITLVYEGTVLELSLNKNVNTRNGKSSNIACLGRSFHKPQLPLHHTQCARNRLI